MSQLLEESAQLQRNPLFSWQSSFLDDSITVTYAIDSNKVDLTQIAMVETSIPNRFRYFHSLRVQRLTKLLIPDYVQVRDFRQHADTPGGFIYRQRIVVPSVKNGHEKLALKVELVNLLEQKGFSSEQIYELLL